MHSPNGGHPLNLSSVYPDWLERLVENTGNELLYEAYEILDSVLPVKKKKLKVSELKVVFDIDEIGLKKAGFFLEDEYEREELIRELLQRSNYWRWG